MLHKISRSAGAVLFAIMTAGMPAQEQGDQPEPPKPFKLAEPIPCPPPLTITALQENMAEAAKIIKVQAQLLREHEVRISALEARLQEEPDPPAPKRFEFKSSDKK